MTTSLFLRATLPWNKVVTKSAQKRPASHWRMSKSFPNSGWLSSELVSADIRGKISKRKASPASFAHKTNTWMIWSTHRPSAWRVLKTLSHSLSLLPYESLLLLLSFFVPSPVVLYSFQPGAGKVEKIHKAFI